MASSDGGMGQLVTNEKQYFYYPTRAEGKLSDSTVEAHTALCMSGSVFGAFFLPEHPKMKRKRFYFEACR